MGRWLARRMAITLATFIGITILVFTLMRLAPVDPVDLLLFNVRESGGLALEDAAELRVRFARELGLDQPIPVQYLLWAKEAITTRNLGFSFVTGQSALAMILERLPPTLMLIGTALLIELIVGVPLGIVAAVRRNRVIDYVISSFGLSVAAVPSFFLSLGAIYLFSVTLRILPPGGMSNPADTGVNLPDVLRHLIMPATVLGLGGAGPVIRYVRTSIIETFSKEYLVVARAKGLSEAVVIVRHAFPNALLPLITIIGLQAAALFAGAFVVEQIFLWPGMGVLGLVAIRTRDYPVIQAFAVITAMVVLLVNVLADVAYAVVDPRIRLA